MRPIKAIGSMFVASALIVLGLFREAWAQSPAPAPPDSSGAASSGGMQVAVVAGLAIALLVILAVLVKMLDLKRKREGEAVIVQSQVSDAVLREPTLFSLPITPTAHVPLWSGSPVTVEVAGCVPSDDLRQAALRVVEREATHLRSDVRIESRIDVVPTMRKSA